LADAVRYADDLLEEVKSKFCNEFSSSISAGGKKFISLETEIDFSERFDSLLKSVEEKCVEIQFCTALLSVSKTHLH
jgi:hypothetical protein